MLQQRKSNWHCPIINWQQYRHKLQK
jgi:hypothetical protein